MLKGGTMKAIAKIIIIVFVAVFVFGAANAQFKKPGDAIKYRKAVMTLIAQHFTRMWIVVQGKADYEKEAFSADADLVAMLASLPGEAFMVPGTDKGDTTMTAAVFDEPAKFKKSVGTFETETAMLASTAKGGELNSIKAQFGKVAQSCNACHKKFRKM
jgi:cytochrome c556